MPERHQRSSSHLLPILRPRLFSAVRNSLKEGYSKKDRSIMKRQIFFVVSLFSITTFAQFKENNPNGKTTTVSNLILPILDEIEFRANEVELEHDGYVVGSSLEVLLGTLNQETFDTLKEKFKVKNDNLQYDSKKEYKLIDFLPKKIQALDRRSLHPIWGSGEDLPSRVQYFMGKVSFQTDCASTAFDLQWVDSRVNVFQPKYDIKSLYLDPRYSKRLMYFDDPSELSTLLDTRKLSQSLEFGDIFLLYVDYGDDGVLDIVHVAFYIDGDLYFEKPGFGFSNYSFSTVKQYFKLSDSNTSELAYAAYEFRRFDVSKLRGPLDALSGASGLYPTSNRENIVVSPDMRASKIGKIDIYGTSSFSLIYDEETELFVLPEAAFSEETFNLNEIVDSILTYPATIEVLNDTVAKVSADLYEDELKNCELKRGITFKVENVKDMFEFKDSVRVPVLKVWGIDEIKGCELLNKRRSGVVSPDDVLVKPI